LFEGIKRPSVILVRIVSHFGSFAEADHKTSSDVSDEAKQHSQKVIDELGDAHYGQDANQDKDKGNVARGYKA
jgi:hypothetical protein